MLKVILSVLLPLIFIGCSDNGSGDVSVEAQQAGAYVIFDSSTNDTAYPNNIFFSDTTNNRLNIPYEDSDWDANVTSALNTLDGFSTISQITISFRGEIEPNSLNDNIHFYKMNAGNITKELTQNVDFITTIDTDKIIINPLNPLDGATTYGVVLMDKIIDSKGNPLAPDLEIELTTSDESLFDESGAAKFNLDLQSATKLESVRLVTIPIIDATLSFDSDILRQNIVAAWSFKTQTIGDFFTNVKDANKSASLHISDYGATTAIIGAHGKADIWVGTISNLPYYLGVPSKEKPTAPVNDSFTDRNGNPTFSYLPRERARLSIPVLVTKPNSSSRAVINGAVIPWPIVIFQHDITKDRTDLLAIADALADVGYAGIAIDMPLHGLDTNSSGFMNSNERTFDLDLVDNTTGVLGADGIIDISGTHYINLDSFLTFRDNIRQSASDLLALKNALYDLEDLNITESQINDLDYCKDGNSSEALSGEISCVDVNGTEVQVSDINCSDSSSSDITCTLTTTTHKMVKDIDSSRVGFIGYSFGAIASSGFLNHTVMESVTLAMSGGGIAQILNNSAKFSPILEAKLESYGIYKGSNEYDRFILDMQTVLDDSDPINYSLNIGNTQKVFAIEVVGNTYEGTSDQVIPNSIANAPLSGTEALLKSMQTVNLTATSSVKPNRAARFMEGNHNSLLDVTASLDATNEMQKQTASFVRSEGRKIIVTDEFILYNP